MKQSAGFTLIEIIVFIVVTSLLASTILLSLNTVSRKSPTAKEQTIATMTAAQCMEWWLGQRRYKGFSSISCPNSSVPSICTAPSGYTISSSVTCTTINGDTQYKTITITVNGTANASLTSLIGDYP